MITQDQVRSLYGSDVLDRDGDRIGSIGQVWDDGIGHPAWASVRTGLFGHNESLVPLQDADLRGNDVVVPFEKAKVKDAPRIDVADDEPLDSAEVDRLYEYYGLSWDESYRTQHATATTGTTRSTDDAMTRSEERLNVGTEREVAGRARLRKYVVTEQQQVTVPVRHEEVRLEREPITGANLGDAYAGPEITENEYEVTLHAERPVVDTEVVPVERVRLSKQTVTEQQMVGGAVRKEHIEAELPGETGSRRID